MMSATSSETAAEAKHLHKPRKHLRGKSMLDAIDLKILTFLQRDGRLSSAEIARKIGGLTKVAVSYRLKRLIQIGVLNGFFARIDPETVGESILFSTRLRIKSKGKKAERVARRISQLRGVRSVFLTFGEYDALVIARAQDARAVRDIVYAMYKAGDVLRSDTVVCHTVIKESLDVALNDLRDRTLAV